MKNLIKLFKENVNLKNHFKNLVNPSCSCTKSLELIVSTLSRCYYLTLKISSIRH
jgi:IS1 family transposase